MSENAIAFYIGLFGSIHCIGMCGPLAFALPIGQHNNWRMLWDKFIYQIGRICSYALLGLIIGIIGKQLWVLGIQRGLSLLSGLVIILAAISRWLKLSVFNNSKPNKILSLVNKLITYALQRHWGHFAVGMINGLLPCGFVYIALLGAMNLHSANNSAIYMAYFGLGTSPLMFLAAVGSSFINQPLRRQLNYVVPYFMICLGCWFLLRGMALNISYLSPLINTGKSICH